MVSEYRGWALNKLMNEWVSEWMKCWAAHGRNMFAQKNVPSPETKAGVAVTLMQVSGVYCSVFWVWMCLFLVKHRQWCVFVDASPALMYPTSSPGDVVQLGRSKSSETDVLSFLRLSDVND